MSLRDLVFGRGATFQHEVLLDAYVRVGDNESMKLTRGQSLIALGLLGAGLDALARRPSRLYAEETLTFSPDGRWIARSNAGGLSLYDAETHEVRWSISWKGGVRALAFSADSFTLAALRLDNQVTIRDVITGVRIQSFPVAEPDQNISGVIALSPSGDRLAVADIDGTIALFHAREARWQRNLDVELTSPKVRALAFSSNGEIIYALTVCQRDTVLVLSSFGGDSGRRLDSPYMELVHADAVALAPDGSAFAYFAGSENRRAFSLIDIRHKRHEVPMDGYFDRAVPQRLAILADAKTLVTFYDKGKIAISPDMAIQGLHPAKTSVGEHAEAITISPDGKKLAFLVAGQLVVTSF